jgi:AraC-like DNA-binding protein
LRPVRFATGALPPGARRRSWEAWNAAALIGLRARLPDPAAFDGVEVNLRLPRLTAAHVRAGPHAVERSTAEIDATPTGAVALYLPVHGTTWFTAGARPQRLVPGQALLCDADLPFERVFEERFAELAVRVPRAELAAAGIVPPAGPRTLDLRAVDRQVREVRRAFGRADTWGVETGLLDLLSRLTTGGPAQVDRLLCARAFIAHRLADPGLSAAQVAAGLGISERTLSRLFAAAGDSVPAYVAGLRLDRARALLRGTGAPVAAVARACGFGSASYFSRAFTARFGQPPRLDRTGSVHFSATGSPSPPAR